MSLILLSGLQIAFIITAASVGVLLLVVIIVILSIKNKHKKDFRFHYYKKVANIAFLEDYYLINNFLFRIDDDVMANVDHILFGDKYIYIISDIYYEGDLSGDENDKSLILFKRNGKKFYTENPLTLSKKIMTCLSALTSIDQSLLVGISLINDDCHVDVESHRKNNYIIQRKKIAQLIKAIESRPVGRINEEQLQNAVQALNKLNRRNRK